MGARNHAGRRRIDAAGPAGLAQRPVGGVRRIRFVLAGVISPWIHSDNSYFSVEKELYHTESGLVKNVIETFYNVHGKTGTRN